MKKLSNIIISILLSSCGSTTYYSNGTKTFYNDGGIAENAAYQETNTTLPNGVTISKKTWGKDQQGFLKTYTQWKYAPGLINTASDGVSTVANALK
jgi:hypothetical protein